MELWKIVSNKWATWEELNTVYNTDDVMRMVDMLNVMDAVQEIHTPTPKENK